MIQEKEAYRERTLRRSKSHIQPFVNIERPKIERTLHYVDQRDHEAGEEDGLKRKKWKRRK